MRGKIIIFCTLLPFLVPSLSFAEEEYFGENPGLDFYSMVDDGAKNMTTGLVKQRLKEYSTFAGFGRSCRSPASWLDATPIDEELLREVSGGIYTRLMIIASSKNVKLTSESLVNLAGCLAETYKNLRTSAKEQQNVLERLGSLGLYTDGDSGNSDYDIIVDIEKINKIIFAEEENYKGKKNAARASFSDILAGKPLRGLFGSSENTDKGNGGTTGNNSGSESDGGSETSSNLSLGIGAMCHAGGQGVTDIDNLINDDFLSDLSNVLAGGDAGGNFGEDYGDPYNTLSDTGNTNNDPSPTSSSDFFHEIPCDSVFCIKVQMVSGNQNLLGGGEKKTIEGILDKHIEIMWPIADSNLAAQKMTNNSFQLTWTNLKFKNLIPKPLLYVSSAPQRTRQDKKNDTPAKKDEKLEAAQKCASYSAGLPNDLNIANSVIGGSYGVTPSTTPTTIENTIKELGPSDPEKKILTACLDVALSEGRKGYYDSFSTDLTEISTFTAGMINEINDILRSGTRLDSLPSQ